MTTVWLLAGLLGAGAHAAPADVILRGGRIFLEPGRYASALAIQGNRVAAVGSDAAIDALRGPRTRVLELGGRAAVPGFHDGHVRLFDGALSLQRVDVSSAASLAQTQELVRVFAAAHPKSAWILGAGWKPAALGGAPTSAQLDEAVKGRPAALVSADGNSMWLNGEALKRARIVHAMVLKKGGQVSRDAKGHPTGLLVGEAMSLATRAIPRPDEDEQLAALRAALALARREGVTSFDAMPDRSMEVARLVELWTRLAVAGEATARLAVFGELDEAAAFAKLKGAAAALPRTRLLLAGVTAELDGRLDRREAALLAPYSDAPSERGDYRHSRRWETSRLRAAHERELQGGGRVRGDRAVRELLDACADAEASARKDGLVLPRYPCRFEGADVVDPEDVPRFAALRAAVSVQPPALLALAADPDVLTRLLGGRVSYVMPWRSLEQAQALLVLGSGWPDGALSPLQGLYAAVVRGLVPEQALSLESAVEHYTADPARALGQGDELGRLLPGQLADIAILDRDIFKDDGRSLPAAAVEATIFDGKVVYERAATP